jgi:futalosine hydrolase
MGASLVVFASRQEFSALFPKVSAVVASSTPVLVSSAVEVAIGGVGLTDFSANLARFLSQKKYERVFLLGICGAYPESGLQLGDVVRVGTEVVADMGVQDRQGHFVPWSQVTGKESVYKGGDIRDLPLTLATFPQVAGASVNCCTGTQYLASRRSSLFDVQVESMEGAAFFAVCNAFRVPAYQYRAVSNIATDRDESSWKIPEALDALKTQVLTQLL